MMKEDYFTKFDPEQLAVGNEAYVIYDLFCRDAENPSKALESLRKEFVPRIQQSSAATSDRGKALILGFDKVLAKFLLKHSTLQNHKNHQQARKKLILKNSRKLGAVSLTRFSHVIARSVATRQSSLFTSRNGLPRCARNDVTISVT